MRAIIGLALGIALAVVGSLAVAGSSYTQPAASGGGVEGDGTGVTDASAFRSALGLGTAAVLAAGSAPSNVVQLDGAGALPAVDGSALTGIPVGIPEGGLMYQALLKVSDLDYESGWTSLGGAAFYETSAFTAADDLLTSIAGQSWSSGTQLLALTGTDTAGLVSTGTSAGNVVVLDGSAKLPAVDGSALTGVSASPYAADSWDAVWEAADGDTGWSLGGGSVASVSTVTTTGGRSAYTITTIGSNSANGSRSLVSSPDSTFELRAQVYLTHEATAGDPQTWFAFGAFGRTWRLVLGPAGIGSHTGSAIAGYPRSGTPINDWVTVTIRVYSPDVSTTPDNTSLTMEVWVGEILAYSVSGVSTLSSGTSNGYFTVGCTTVAGSAAVAWVAWRDGTNAAPPSYTYRGLGYAPDVAAP